MAQIIPQADFDPDKVKAYGPGLENGVNPKEKTHFTIDASDAGDAPLEVSIVDDLGEYEPEMKQKTEKVFECTYTPRNGQHKVNSWKFQLVQIVEIVQIILASRLNNNIFIPYSKQY